MALSCVVMLWLVVSRFNTNDRTLHQINDASVLASLAKDKKQSEPRKQQQQTSKQTNKTNN